MFVSNRTIKHIRTLLLIVFKTILKDDCCCYEIILSYDRVSIVNI